MARRPRASLIGFFIPKKLETKFITTSVLTLFLVIWVVGYGFYRNQESNLIANAEKSSLEISKTIGLAFTNILVSGTLGKKAGGEYFESTISELKKHNPQTIDCIRLYNTEKKLIASSRLADFSGALDLDLDLKGLDPAVVKLEKNLLKTVVPLHTASKVWGYSAITFRLDPYRSVLSSLFIKVVVGGLLIILLGAAFSALIARQLAWPIKDLSSAMASIEPGRFNLKLKVNRNDEIGALQEKFINLINRLKTAAEYEKEMNSRLVQTEKLAAIGTLTSGIAHEINNPITGMESCLSHLTRHLEKDETAQRYLAPVSHSLEHIKKVVGELLGYSRKQTHQFISEDLGNIIGQALEMASFKLREKKIIVSRVSSPETIRGFWDAMALKQVFLNLFLNAAEVLGEKGEINIHCALEGERAVIEVHDNGPGVPEEIRKKIFDPFFSRNSSGKGTGLGLSVSQKIIQEHDGAIWLVPGVPTGTTFAVSLPLQRKGTE